MVIIMQKFIEDIYKDNKCGFNMFGFDPDSCDDIKKDSYIYAWFTNNSNKCFYVGKGKKDRYNHILLEIIDAENNPKKYKGKKYKILKDTFGINYKILYNNLTEKEAQILEAYSIVEMFRNKQPLLNVILPDVIMENEELLNYRDNYFYEKELTKFLEFYK